MSYSSLTSQAVGFTKYTPSSGSTIPYKFATFYLPADSTMSVTDYFDHEEDNVLFSAGYHPLIFKKIRSSTGDVYLTHNGETGMSPHLINFILSN